MTKYVCTYIRLELCTHLISKNSILHHVLFIMNIIVLQLKYYKFVV